MDIAQALQSAIYIVSTSLLYPVIVILLGMVALTVVEIGMFSFELLMRVRGKNPEGLERRIFEAKKLIDGGKFEEGVEKMGNSTSKLLLYFFLDGLLEIKKKGENKDLFLIDIEKLLQRCESFISKRLERTKVMIRLGPMLGLMGTLIPMGPALLALTKGDINTLANNLIIAFGTTVVGLLIGGVSYVIYTIRRRWYDDDMSDIRYICEVLFGEREVGSEK
ncbi:MAG: MotA/TolQ/ExbB proton channel family protein [Candidatus Methanospirareceae archaeon]